MNIKCKVNELLIKNLKSRVIQDYCCPFDERVYSLVESILEGLNYEHITLASTEIIYYFILEEVPYDILKDAEAGEHLAEDIVENKIFRTVHDSTEEFNIKLTLDIIEAIVKESLIK